MKRFLLFLLLAWSAYGQAPLVRNSFTTNSPAKAPTPLATTTSALWPLMILDPGAIAGDRTIAYAPAFYMSNGVAHFAGNVNMHTLTAGTLLQANGGLNVVSVANGAEGTMLGISNGVPAYVNATAQVWTNAAGIVQPVDWPTRAIQVDGIGGLWQGSKATNWYGGNGDGSAIVSLRDVSAGDPSYQNLSFDLLDNFASPTQHTSFQWSAYPDGNQFASELTIRTIADTGGAGTSTFSLQTKSNSIAMSFTVLNASRTILDPASAAGGPYLFDTSTTIDSSDPIVTIGNHGTNVVQVLGSGGITLSRTTNQLTDDGTQLLRNGTPVGSGSATNPTQNYYSTSNYFTVGKGGKLTVTNGITTLDVAASSLLRTDSNQKIAPATIGSGLSFDGTTLSASGGGGASTWLPNTTLTYSGGTNVTIDGSGGTNFVLTVTNTTFFTAPNNRPGATTTNTAFTIFFKMDSTGGYSVTFTNTYFKFPAGVVFVPTTNANAISSLAFTMSPFTAGQFYADYGSLDIK